MIISYSPIVHSVISGELSTFLETDHSVYNSANRAEEQANINWQNNNKSMLAGFQFDIEHKEDEISATTNQQINQLFFSQKSNNIDYTLGRFNRSDSLGYYTLDGIVAKYKHNEWSTGFHSGKPLQIEDYNIINAHRIYGIDLNHHARYKNIAILQNVSSFLGWQQITDIEEQSYIHWGISSNGELDSNRFKQAKIIFNSSYIVDDESFESINAIFQGHSKDYGLARISFTSWQPEEINLSFKEQFYSVYANEKQSILQADFFRNYKWNQQYYFRGRKVWRESRDHGAGITAGLKQKTSSGKNFSWQSQWDSLKLEDDYIHSIYLGINKNISVKFRGHLDTAVQYSHKQLQQDNTALALEAGAERMLRSDLFIDFDVRYIYNNNLENEYRFSFNLSYRFDDSIRGRK
jgi:hypothetical protein